MPSVLFLSNVLIYSAMNARNNDTKNVLILVIMTIFVNIILKFIFISVIIIINIIIIINNINNIIIEF